MTETPGQIAEAVARVSRARLVAYLAGRTRDLAAAEDALAEAFARALETWPRDGVPRAPEAWLLTVARRAHGARARSAARAAAAEPVLALAWDEAAARIEADEEAGMRFPDERLKLMFVCAHPAIDPNLHTALMLQVVLGLDAARIAAAYLVAPAAMGQRLVRAKAKIKAARLRFAVPEPAELHERMEAVREAIFGAFGTGWDAATDPDAPHRGLAEEAVHLGRMLVEVDPDHPETLGLLALMLHASARLPARRDAAGGYVPLEAQDPKLWNEPRMDEADALCIRAGRLARFGRFQCAAAIQAVHSARRSTGRTDHAALDILYRALEQFSPTVGVRVARAAAAGRAHGPEAGLSVLAALPEAQVERYQPFWAVRASLLNGADQKAASRAAYGRAIALCEDPAVRAYLVARRDQG